MIKILYTVKYYNNKDSFMRIIRTLISIILILIICISPLSGCGDKTDEAYIYFELPEIPLTLDPQTASSDAELVIIKNIFEGLLRLDKDGNITNGIAESYSKEGLKYTFKLREDAVWSNGEKVTADDFVFAFRRALNPETKAPFAKRLISIKNAKEILDGKKSVNELGIRAVDEKTVEITQAFEDSEFEKNLTSSVAMPCNQKLFLESEGKYGLVKDYIISNGSYRLTKWNKTSFGIRLYRREDYKGNFYAKNAAIFITCRTDEDTSTELKENNIDMAFVNSAVAKDLISFGLKTIEYQNICWLLTINSDFSSGMRNALRSLIGSEIYSANLPYGYSSAQSIFPSVITTTPPAEGITIYNSEKGKKLFKEEINKISDRKFPADTILYYYDNGYIKPIVTDIVGHWQSQLSAFVNIEAASDSNLLTPELINPTLSMSIFPIRADSSDVGDYLSKFGIEYKKENLGEIQNSVLKNSTVIPLFFENTCIAYSPNLTEITTFPWDGFIDFSTIVKYQKN